VNASRFKSVARIFDSESAHAQGLNQHKAA